MAEDSDLERTESPSERRIEKAREEGQVARSRELSTFLVMFVAAGAFTWMGGQIIHNLSGIFREGLRFSRVDVFDSHRFLEKLHSLSVDAFIHSLPILLSLLLACVLAPLIMGGWLFSTKAFMPNFNRLNPVSGIARMFSKHGLGELGKAILKCILIGVISIWLLWNARNEIIALTQVNVIDGLSRLGHLVTVTFFSLTGALALIAAIDVPFQLWNHYSQLKMTKQEVRDEAREMEGDPAVKARIRSLQRQAARRRMMANVPKADVIVTNPTHYAVALSYKDFMNAPRVVAKGSALIAQRIREIGDENHIPIMEAPPLARALYTHTDIDQEIPNALYEAVALVMAYVYQLKRYNAEGGIAPQMPQDLPVPAELDPGVA